MAWAPPRASVSSRPGCRRWRRKTWVERARSMGGFRSLSSHCCKGAAAPALAAWTRSVPSGFAEVVAVVLAAFQLPGFRVDCDAFAIAPVAALLQGVALGGELRGRVCGGAGFDGERVRQE